MSRNIILVLSYHCHRLLENMVVSPVRTCGYISRSWFSIYYIFTLRSDFHTKTFYSFFISPIRAPCTTLLIFCTYFTKSTNFDAPHYVNLSVLALFPLSQVQVLSPGPCFQEESNVSPSWLSTVKHACNEISEEQTILKVAECRILGCGAV
jgi:hypothetical protein